jgi:hypothetical protein
MRGFGTPSFCSDVRTPSPQPSPLWGEGVFCASLRVLAWQTPSFSRRVSAPELFRRAVQNGARLQNVVTSSAKPVRSKERAGVGPGFLSSVTSVSPDQSNKLKEAERRQTQGNTAASCDAARAPLHILPRKRGRIKEGARTLDGVPPRLSPKGVIVPKAQLQARLPGTWSARALPAFACPSPGMHLPPRS